MVTARQAGRDAAAAVAVVVEAVAVGEAVVAVAVDEHGLVEIPLTGVGLRAPLLDWIRSRPRDLHCLEVTAEHFPGVAPVEVDGVTQDEGGVVEFGIDFTERLPGIAR